jgi:hypothetical protein
MYQHAALRRPLSVILLAGAVVYASAGAAHAAVIGPTPYLSQADSPFNPSDFDYFFLEDLEDDALNTTGISASASCIAGFNCFVGAGLTDSVGNGGNGQLGRSLFANGSITLTFDASALGALPTAAGFAWTDGTNPITFEAFDQNNNSLGVIVGNHADGSFAGTTGEDRFYGATNAGGISRLVISDPTGVEIDHIQYGGLRSTAVPEPATWTVMLVGFALAGMAMRRRRMAEHSSD